MDSNRYKRHPVKNGYGVACCRYNKQKKQMEVLMIKKRYTYYYIEFILGHYPVGDLTRIKYLLNNMTHDEKMEIYSKEFGRMWYRIWLTNPDNPTHNVKSDVDKSHYIRCKKKFERTFSQNSDPNLLHKLLSESKNDETIWEIPKGRKDHPQESDLNCAIRELHEETGMSCAEYTILSEIDPLELKFSNRRACYHYTYYVAVEDNSIVRNKCKWSHQYQNEDKFKINFKNINQISEVASIQWMTLNKLKNLDKTNRYAPFVQKLFAILKNRYQLGKLSNLNL